METSVLEKLPSIEPCMNRLDRAEPIGQSCLLAHIHIPKTAGMAVQTVLKKHLSPHTHFAWNNAAAEWKDLTDGQEYSGRLITGHLRYPHLFYPGFSSDRRIYCISVIRDPLKRVISLYNYNRSLRHPKHEAFSARFPDINDFVKAQSNPNRTRNQQAFWLCGSRTSPEVLSEVLNKHYLGISTQEYLIDYLSKILRFCGEDTGVVAVPTVNAIKNIKSGHAAKRADIDPVILNEFIRDNQLDYQLYYTVSEHLKSSAIPDKMLSEQTVTNVRTGVFTALQKTVNRLFRN